MANICIAYVTHFPAYFTKMQDYVSFIPHYPPNLIGETLEIKFRNTPKRLWNAARYAEILKTHTVVMYSHQRCAVEPNYTKELAVNFVRTWRMLLYMSINKATNSTSKGFTQKKLPLAYTGDEGETPHRLIAHREKQFNWLSKCGVKIEKKCFNLKQKG